MRVVDSLSIIFAVLYITIVVLLSIFVVHPLATGTFMKKKQKPGEKEALKEKALSAAKKIRAIPVLFHWYLVTIILGVSIFSILVVLENTIMTQYSMPAIMDVLFSTENEEDEDDPYDWQFGDPLGEGEIPGGSQVIYQSEAEAVVEAAWAELNYYESNNVKGGQRYWTAWHDSGYGISNGPWHWCAGFVGYVLTKAGVSSLESPGSADSSLTIPSAWTLSLSCTTMVNAIKSGSVRGTWHQVQGSASNPSWTSSTGSTEEYIPQPGDIVIFSEHSNPGSYQHVAIVVDVDEDKHVYTIGGNEGGHGEGSAFASSSKVNYMDSKYGAFRGSSYKTVVFYTPDYKKTIVGSGTVIGNFDISAYPTDSSGDYSAEIMPQLMYDFFRIELGYNSAAACGILASISAESGARYDIMENANYGRAYWDYITTKEGGETKFYITDPSKSTRLATKKSNGNYEVLVSSTSNYFVVPSKRYQHNVMDVPNIEETIMYAGTLCYQHISASTAQKYGMGYGLMQWSFGRRVGLINNARANNLGNGYGPGSLLAQLDWIRTELTEGSYKKVNEYLLNVPDTAQGAYDAASYWTLRYEVPSDASEKAVTRGNDAKNNWWVKFGGTNPSVIVNTGGSGGSGSATVSDISNYTVIGDSNTVRMYNYDTAIADAKNVYAIVGVSTGGWDSYNNSSNTTGGKTLKECIEQSSSSDLSNVIIMLGTNDYGNPSGIASNYTEILDCIISKNSKANIIICTVPPVNDSYSSTITNEQATAVCNAIKSFVSSNSSRYNLSLLDVNSQLTVSDMSTASGDGYHLSRAGATKCANVIAGLS